MRVLSCVALLAIMLSFPGCGTPTPACGPSSCTGCCMGDGTCQQGNQNVACGTQGRLCDVCSFQDRCEFGACFPVQSGGGAGGGGGTVTGGGGGTVTGGGGGTVTGGGGGAVTGGGGGGAVTGGGGGGAVTGGGGGGAVTGGGGGATGGGGGATGGGGGATGGGGGVTGGGGGSIGGGGGGGGGGATGSGTGGGSSTDGGLTGQLWMRGALDAGAAPAIHRQLPVGTVPTQFSTFPRRSNGLAVTTDGTLAAVSYDGAADDLVLRPATGGAETLIHTTAGTTQLQLPQFSPDKTQIAFTEGGGGLGFDLFVMPAMSGGTVRRASPTRTATNLNNVNDHAFSRDSRYLALTGDLTVDQTFELHVFDLMTGTITPLITSATATAGSGAGEFGWTNTGQVLVRAGIGGGARRLHLCTVTGTCTPLPGTTATFTVGALAVSADGSFAVYSSNERGTGAYDLYRVSTAGGTPLRLAADVPPGWNPGPGSVVISPNGQWVTAQANATLGLGVYVFSTAGGSPLTPLYIATGTVAVFALTFSPDSNVLAFRADINLNGSYDLFRFADLTTPMQTPILLQHTQGGSITELRWTP